MEPSMSQQTKPAESLVFPTEEDAEAVMQQLTLDFRLDYLDTLETDVEWFSDDLLK